MVILFTPQDGHNKVNLLSRPDKGQDVGDDHFLMWDICWVEGIKKKM